MQERAVEHVTDDARASPPPSSGGNGWMAWGQAALKAAQRGSERQADPENNHPGSEIIGPKVIY